MSSCRRRMGLWWCRKNATTKMFYTSSKRSEADTLLPLIMKYIKPGSIIHSDCWKAYNWINNLTNPDYDVFEIPQHYIHKTVNHSIEYVNKTDSTHTNTIEGTWFGIKIRIPNWNQTKDFIDGFTLEFIWHRQHAGNVWEGLLSALFKVEYPLLYRMW